MKKFISVTLAILTAVTLILSSATTFADTEAANANKGSTTPQNFEEHKAKVLRHIGERIAKMQEAQNCVKAANDLKSMQACRPNYDKSKHGHDGTNKS